VVDNHSILKIAEPHPTADSRWRETHEQHTSEDRSFRSCRQRWDWAYRQGYVPDRRQKALENGIVFHEGLQVFYTPETWETTTAEEKLQASIDTIVRCCEEQRAFFLSLSNQEKLAFPDGDDYSDRIDLLIEMMTWYARNVHPEQDNWFRPVMVEVAFQVPLTDPQTGEQLYCSNPGTQPGQCGQNHPVGAPVTFDGRVDMIIEDKLYGGYFAWDHKTAGILMTEDKVLHLDEQVLGYMWALRDSLGIDVRGFLYCEYRKDYPKPPELLTRRYKGKLFSTTKDQPTTYSIFKAWVEKYDPEGYNEGCYKEYLDFLRSKDATVFHKRWTILKTPTELANAGRDIANQAAEMVDPRLRIYRSANKMQCKTCPYYQPCRGQLAGEDYLYSLNTLFRKVK
jgi:hypothetical protein